MHALVLAALLSAPSGAQTAGPAPAADRVEQRREAMAKELVGLGAELRRQISAGQVDALVARVPAEGLRCAGRLVPRAKVERDLRTPGSWLHDVFFGGPSQAPRRGAPPSVADFLRTAKDVAILVSFQPDAVAGPAGRPCIDFRAEGLVTPGAPLCFVQREGRWLFTESLYPCG